MQQTRVRALGILFLAAVVGIPAYGFQGKGQGGGGRAGGRQKPDGDDKTTYSFSLPAADGTAVPMSSFKGKTVMLVNLGRLSRYNDQLPALIALSQKYQDKGLVVIGIPSNEFGAAEPGTDAEIQKAYKDLKVPFVVMAKSTITGDDILPFYDYLTKGKSAPAGGAVHWNYTKFILDKDGKRLLRFEPDVTPDSVEMNATLDQIFDGTYKPKTGAAPKGGGGDMGGGGPE
jgi:glutathione peroxidase